MSTWMIESELAYRMERLQGGGGPRRPGRGRASPRMRRKVGRGLIALGERVAGPDGTARR
jgi:hypothetical protein